jgi:hypothetical protein
MNERPRPRTTHKREVISGLILGAGVVVGSYVALQNPVGIEAKPSPKTNPLNSPSPSPKETIIISSPLD